MILRNRRPLSVLCSAALLLASLGGCSFFGIRTEETPRYEVLARDGGMEIRRYEPTVTAEITTTGTFDGTQRESFFALAGYIFGKNAAAEKVPSGAVLVASTRTVAMAMTAPVAMKEAPGQSWTMAFVLPRKFTLETAPRPLDSRIELKEYPVEITAAARFSWGFTEARAKKFEARLRDWLEAQGTYEPAGAARVGGYDPPWTLPFLKRNEVLIPVHVKHAP
jgi:hypothetical protein